MIIIIIVVSIIIMTLMWDSIGISLTCGEGSGAPRRRQRAPNSSVSKKALTRQQEQVFSIEVDKRDLFVDLEHQQVLEKATQNQSKLKKSGFIQYIWLGVNDASLTQRLTDNKT